MSGEFPQIDFIEKKQIRETPLAEFRAGDTVRVHYEIKEGDKKRIQVFQGVVIRIKGRKTLGPRSSFTVRKVSHSVGVEKTFPFNSPNLKKVEVVTRGKVRKSRLYYLRKLSGKSARIQERTENRGAKKVEATTESEETKNKEEK